MSHIDLKVCHYCEEAPCCCKIKDEREPSHSGPRAHCPPFGDVELGSFSATLKKERERSEGRKREKSEGRKKVFLSTDMRSKSATCQSVESLICRNQ